MVVEDNSFTSNCNTSNSQALRGQTTGADASSQQSSYTNTSLQYTPPPATADTSSGLPRSQIISDGVHPFQLGAVYTQGDGVQFPSHGNPLLIQGTAYHTPTIVNAGARAPVQAAQGQQVPLGQDSARRSQIVLNPIIVPNGSAPLSMPIKSGGQIDSQQNRFAYPPTPENSRTPKGYTATYGAEMPLRRQLISTPCRPENTRSTGGVEYRDLSKDVKWENSLRSALQVFELLLNPPPPRGWGYWSLLPENQSPKPLHISQAWEVYQVLLGENAAPCFQSALRYFDYYSELRISDPIPQSSGTPRAAVCLTPRGSNTPPSTGCCAAQIIVSAQGFRQFAADTGLCTDEQWPRYARGFGVFSYNFQDEAASGTDSNEARRTYWSKFGLSSAAFVLGVLMTSSVGRQHHIPGSPAFTVRMRYIFEYFGFREGMDPQSALDELLECCPGSNCLTVRYNLENHIKAVSNSIAANDSKMQTQAYLNSLFSQICALAKSRFISGTESLVLFKGGVCPIFDKFLDQKAIPAPSLAGTTNSVRTIGPTVYVAGGLSGSLRSVPQFNVGTATAVANAPSSMSSGNSRQ
eukprot:Filipodium_phascolosomae@DN1661_c0_g1_i1.p1